MSEQAERREFSRIPFRTDVKVRAGGRTITAEDGVDVSMNGLRIPSGGPAVPEGTGCVVRIVLRTGGDGRTVIEATGTVARSAAGTLAVHFTGIDPESFEHLSRLIRLNTEQPEVIERELREHWGIKSRKA